MNDVTTTGIGRIEFVTQPPANLRKSNFFHFVLSIVDAVGHPAEVEDAVFVGFVDEIAGNDASQVNNGKFLFSFLV